MSRKKPNFTGSKGFWLNPDHLPSRVRIDLSRELARSQLPIEKQQSFLRYATMIAQFPDTNEEPLAVQRDRIAKVASDARRLLGSLRTVGEPAAITLGIHAREAILFRHPDVPNELAERVLSSGHLDFLDETWNWVHTLRVVSEEAISAMEPSRQAKPKQAKARALVSNMAIFYWRLAGEFPPSDSASWFAGFARQLGAHMDLEIGPRLVKSGIEDAKR
ncbi:MAG: hypothetical protein K0M64_01670 [Rhizobium sp.]|nr:hypothetical protein [Rhizobium sp.]